MAEEDHQATHAVPSDISQVPIVWRYEILRYLRSRRLMATLAIVGVIILLIYLIPPLSGSSYSGTDTERALYVLPFNEYLFPDAEVSPEYVAYVNRTVVVTGTIEVFLDGESYPSMDGANWVFVSQEEGDWGFNAILLMQDISGSEVSATYDWHVSSESFDSSFIGFVSILIIVCVTFFAADSLVGEFQNKTGYLLFPNAVKRGTLFVGKFAASMTMGILVIGIFYGVIAVLSAISAGGIDDDYLLSFLFAAEYMFAATAIAYFISSLLKGTTGAIVLTFFMLFMIIPIVDAMSMVSGVKIEGSVTFAAGVITSILVDPYPVDTTSTLGADMGVEFHQFYPTPETAALVMLIYAIMGCVLSMVLFKRKQLAG
jgi:ABC-type transport system involved in multi-copper enzyme maturation permease subunit